MKGGVLTASHESLGCKKTTALTRDGQTQPQAYAAIPADGGMVGAHSAVV